MYQKGNFNRHWVSELIDGIISCLFYTPKVQVNSLPMPPCDIYQVVWEEHRSRALRSRFCKHLPEPVCLFVCLQLEEEPLTAFSRARPQHIAGYRLPFLPCLPESVLTPDAQSREELWF